MAEDKKLNTIWTGDFQEAILENCILSEVGLDSNKKSVLLHSCCGPCSTSVIERLSDDFNITVYFYNPNITDEREYRLRRDTQVEFIEKFNMATGKKVGFIEGPYDKMAFLDRSSGMEGEPEGGLRCTGCFELRLRKTGEEAKSLEFDYFATTLTVSPHKDYKIISAIGNNLGAELGIDYLDMDFKKKDGFKRSIELSKKYGLYRQNFCGCLFSER
ncbi:MAG: epoxyqueuosine reductase QueH [Peptostreptococcaceae bacterium]|nr:epoxyqueuosine reductase QueH [Peptostreptococcaceae bacterium]MDY5738630.1 epoxyqueuosine reductase QueH [Anaerovoracaceae bacterium]